MATNPLLGLAACGQSLWLDFINRDLLDSGGLRRLIREDGLRGLTSNPTIFQQAVSRSPAYAGQIREAAARGAGARVICDAVTQRDVQRAADEFRPLFESTGGADGYASLEADPRLARDTEGTIRNARELWAALDRPNVFVKVPATDEGIPAIRRLLAEGVNINITLLFGLRRYRQVAEAYLAALEERAGRGEPLSVASVASFFVSRIDTKVDARLQAFAGPCGERPALAGALYGQVAVACARMAYRLHGDIFGSRRFWELAKKGARKQRLLWASTGTKNPEFSDIKYVEELIGPNTVSTCPLATIEAYRDHGSPQVRIDSEVSRAAWVLDSLPLVGISMDDIALELEREGAASFSRSYDELLAAIESAAQRRQAA